MTFRELTLSRANKSLRAFNYVVDCLSDGKQPDKSILNKIGYLYRTTAVYGSGKFGLADRFRIKNRPEIMGPFRLEMMLVYFVRQFTFDQVNHIAKSRSQKNAVELDKKICRSLGIGNSTGLGMAPFIINHPTLLNNWIMARENALKKIREIKNIKIEDFNYLFDCIKKSTKNIYTWETESDYQNVKIQNLKNDLTKVIKFLNENYSEKKNYFLNEFYLWAEKNLSEEGTEYVVSILMEPYDNIVEPLISTMSSNEEKYFNIPTHKTVRDLINILEKYYSNLINIDFNKDENNHNFWFISKNKEEPRIASRFKEKGSELEQPLAIGRDIHQLYTRASSFKQSVPISRFLMDNNDLRHVVRRAFLIENFPYSEIQDNTIGHKLIPVDMLRLKLSFFGACKFDPRSDKWLRICMFQGAPLPHNLKNYDEQWVYKVNL